MSFIKTTMAEMPKKKKLILLFLLISGPILVEALIIYFFTISGGVGTYQWMGNFRFLIPLAVIGGIFIPILPIIDIAIAKKRNPEKIKVPSKLLWATLLLAVIIPTSAFIYFGSAPIRRAGDKAPSLFILNGVGTNKVPNMAVVTWTEQEETLSLLWGSNSNMTNTPIKSGPSKSHGFLLPNLLPDTTYFYQIQGKSTTYNFTTMKATPNVLKFAVSSDCHIGAGTNNKTATTSILSQAVKPANNYDMFFSLGDIVEFGHEDTMWKEFFDTFSPYTSQIPYRSAVGNHDTMIGGLNLWEDYFAPDDLKNIGPKKFAHIETNDIHIFVMDLEWGVETYDDAQKTWFEQEIKKLDPNDWIVVMNHAMYYTSGTESTGINWADPPEMVELAKKFPEYGVDFVFTGHNHHMESLMVSNVSYSVIGAFGGHFDSERVTNGTGSLWYQDHQFGFASVEFTGNNASVSYRTPENIELYKVELPKIR
jgi:calcineurin-like phosphoesterase family protein